MRVFVIKCSTVQQLFYSFKEEIWAVPLRRHPPLPHEVLNDAFQSEKEKQGGGEVILIASVSASQRWFGFAVMKEMISNETYEKEGRTMTKPFHLEWICRFQRVEGGVPFSQTSHLYFDWEGNKEPINQSRNCQEILPESGTVLCDMIKSAVQNEAIWLREEEKRKTKIIKSLIETEEGGGWAPFLSSVEKFGKVIFATHIGSKAYNVTLPESDIDICVIVTTPTHILFSLKPPPTTIKNPANFKPDYTVHEIKSFCTLLMGGDPRIIELLFSNSSVEGFGVVFESYEWLELKNLRDLFLSKKMVQKYLSELDGIKGIRLIEELQKKGEPFISICKKYYIFTRQLILAERILKSKETPFSIWFDDSSQEREFLLDIRRGKFSLDQLNEIYLSKRKNLEKILNSSDLRDSTPKELEEILFDWILKNRLQILATNDSSTSTSTTKHSSHTTLHPPLPLELNTIQTTVNSFNGTLLFLKQIKTLPPSITSDPSVSIENSQDVQFEFVGVYIVQTKLFLNPFYTIQEMINGVCGENLTFTVFELSKLCSMILHGNPNTLELILTDCGHQESIFSSPLWDEFQKFGDTLITSGSIDRCLGSLKAQLRLWGKRKQAKKGSDSSITDLEIFRSLHHIDFLKAIVNRRNGSNSAVLNLAFLDDLTTLLNEVNENYKSTFPSEPNTQTLEQWLINCRECILRKD